MKRNKYLTYTLLYMFTYTTITIGKDVTVKNNKAYVPCVHQQDSLARKERTIEVVCNVMPEQLKVKHWGITHTPDEFGLEINQQPIFSQAKDTDNARPAMPTTITIVNNRIMCDYSYSFARGTWKEKKRAHLEIPESVKRIEVSFSFTDDQRVLIPQARLLGTIETVLCN